MTNLTIDLREARQRPVDYLNICKNIADSYPFGIAHGIQKDAIQNGKDVRLGPGPVKFTFELIQTAKGSFFTMNDTNTSGLTGSVLPLEAYENGQLGPGEHWARFESFAFTKDDPDAIGARGQGKFVFLAGSKQGAMFYDSLRRDRTYRLGFTKAKHTDCPLVHWDAEEGRKMLKSQTGLDPLSEVGTRIIIVDPIDELVQDLKKGIFTQAIQETWFRAIEKGLVEIHLKIGKEDQIIGAPAPFPVPLVDSDKFKTWGSDLDSIEPIRGEKYRIKNLRIARKIRGVVPDYLRGVAIIHGGMKICSLNMEWAPPNIRDSIFGFIEFDRELDRELRKNINQNPNHYDLRWRKSIPRAIKAYVEEQLKEFGVKKLGIGIDPRESKKLTRNAAEEWAIKNLAKYAKELDLFGATAKGGVKPSTDVDTHPKTKGLAIHGFEFPEPSRAPRVNWGEAIQGFTVSIFNKTGKPFSAQLRIILLFGDKVVQEVDIRGKVEVPARGSSAMFGPYKIAFKKELFPDSGIYRLRAKLVDEGDKNEIDVVTRTIFLEKDPAFRTPFEVQAVPGFPEQYRLRQWKTSGLLGLDPTLYYNTEHPAYRQIEHDEIEQGYYLLDIFLEGSISFILNRPDRPDGTEDFHPLDSSRMKGDPKDAYDEIVGKLSEIRSRVYSET